MEEIRKQLKSLIVDICRKKDIPATFVLDKLDSLSNEELIEYFQESWLKLN